MTYYVYKNNVKESETESTESTLTDLTPATHYKIAVSDVVDGNESDPAELDITTNGRLTVPTTNNVAHVRHIDKNTGINTDVPIIRTYLDGVNRVIEVPPDFHMNDTLATLISKNNWSLGSMYVKDLPKPPNLVINGAMQNISKQIGIVDKYGGYSATNMSKLAYVNTDYGRAMSVDTTQASNNQTGITCVTPSNTANQGDVRSVGVLVWAQSPEYVGLDIELRIATTSWIVLARKTVQLTAEPQWINITATVSSPTNSRLHLAVFNQDLKFYATNFMMIEGTTLPIGYHPSSEDYGIVHGQPNLLNNTSEEWLEYTFTGTTPNSTSRTLSIASLGLSVGDKVSLAYEVDNTATSNTDTVSATISFMTNSDVSYISDSVTSVPSGSTGTTTCDGTINTGVTHLRVDFLTKSSDTNSATINVRKHKLIKGSADAMDDYTQSQTDSGLTVIDDGMVPFTANQYDMLLNTDEFVNAETNIVDETADIQLTYDIVSELTLRYPDVFTGVSVTDQLVILKNAVRSLNWTVVARGSGYSRMEYLNQVDKTWVYDSSNDNTTGDFAEQNVSRETLTTEQKNQLFSATGSFVAKVVSNVTNGITSASVDVKTSILTLSLVLNNETRIESFTGMSSIYSITKDNTEVEIITQ